MKRRHDATLTAGLCASLVAHGLIVFGASVIYIDRLESRIWQPPLTRELAQATGTTSSNEFQLGEETGTGTAIAPMIGDQDALARQANSDQPFTSLDPAGFGKVGDPPAPSAAPPGEGGGGGAPARFGLPSDTSTMPQPRPRPPLAQRRAVPTAEEISPSGTSPALPPDVASNLSISELPTVQEPAEAPQTQVMAANLSNVPQATVAPGAPGERAASADPAPLADSEIDPFAKTGAAEFRSGRTNVQFGRKSKLTRPRVLLAGQMDLIGKANPRVTLAIATDASGKVTDVAVRQSSGSPNIDQPVRVAAYDWWFEPPRDAAGQPQPDAFLFTVSFVGS
ncbi:MAG TPA: TonB family protein [Tepidisphaeraceae bacterium]|jgi:TonB family protein|nr:TonB family protein [Tepidisphaeraceae bacterium]